ncbi:potassium channel family protein [Aliiglaciecola sp. CAU 1673]|uniref:potassium channel family protein n=1 Tax=Aliiglaciecola sp. CAU 1673 TaxID=3032595 RepID=UPI0023DC5995|nr:potassium channel family protein [Aliiglaciecola sp. CAU 1673]MDF2180042.1 potassium channel family protein [Aliiglaciecola sp. CAU 1673]
MTENDAQIHLDREPLQRLGPFDIGMMILSLVAVTVVVIFITVPLSHEVRSYLLFMDTLICGIFLTHFFYHVATATNRLAYIKEHWIDFVASVPLIEPLRLARFLQVLRVIRLLKMTRHLVLPSLRDRIQTTLATMMVALVILIGVAGLSIFLIEHDLPNSNIRNAEDAIWWSLVTISTVGYGDYYPVSTAGRVVSMLLILSGVSLFGVISGYIASYFITPEEKDQLAVQNRRINQLQGQMESMQHSLSKLHDKLDKLMIENDRSKS